MTLAHALPAQVTPGSLFICERGAEFDGHEFVNEVRPCVDSANAPPPAASHLQPSPGQLGISTCDRQMIAVTLGKDIQTVACCHHGRR